MYTFYNNSTNQSIVENATINQHYGSSTSRILHNEAGNFTGYFADDIFVLMPEGPLGETHYGTTPEESDLMTGATSAEVSLVNNSVAVTTSKIVDPVNVETKVSMVMLPSFEQADAVFILDVDPTTL